MEPATVCLITIQASQQWCRVPRSWPISQCLWVSDLIVIGMIMEVLALLDWQFWAFFSSSKHLAKPWLPKKWTTLFVVSSSHRGSGAGILDSLQFSAVYWASKVGAAIAKRLWCAPLRDGASDLCGSSTVGQKKKTEGLSENGVHLLNGHFGKYGKMMINQWI